MSLIKLIKEFEEDAQLLPQRETEFSAGYDLRCAEEVVVPSLWKLLEKKRNVIIPYTASYDLDTTKVLLKEMGIRPTLVRTGVKAKLDGDQYGGVHARSSTPLNYMLIGANDEGIIDADYYNNEKNEGEIHVMLLNLAPFDIKIKKYDRIGQLIVKGYETFNNEVYPTKTRNGGFGHTGGTNEK